jgi:hypothetical protein
VTLIMFFGFITLISTAKSALCTLLLLLYILRRKSLTVRNSAHRKSWPNYSSKRIPREPVFELFGSCPVARRRCLMQLRTKI